MVADGSRLARLRCVSLMTALALAHLDSSGRCRISRHRTNGAKQAKQSSAETDEVARRWVLADIRRGNADSWAMKHLRTDIVDARVLGPPGLNGTGKAILAERAKGTVELVSARSFPVVAAVIAVPPDLKREDASAGLTDFVIVSVFRATGRPIGERIRSDGSREPLHSRHLVGELGWQLDAGEFREDPIIGPIWYQAAGWSCIPGHIKAVPRLCAMVQPDQ